MRCPHWCAHSLVIGLLVLALGAGCSGDASSTSPSTTAATAAPPTFVPTPTPGGLVPAPEGIPGVVLERAPSRNHTNAKVDYHGAKPPTGGDHNPVPAPCTFYDQQIPDENGVHSLEHGAVWIAFTPAPATSTADIATIKSLVAGHAKVLASPYAGLRTPVVLVAWERRLEVASIGDPRVGQFINTYAGGTTAPEPHKAC